VTLSIVGGADQGRFSINSSGELTFNATPDFERPSDADGDNRYEVRVQAVDAAGRSTWQILTITVVDQGEAVPTPPGATVPVPPIDLARPANPPGDSDTALASDSRAHIDNSAQARTDINRQTVQVIDDSGHVLNAVRQAREESRTAAQASLPAGPQALSIGAGLARDTTMHVLPAVASVAREAQQLQQAMQEKATRLAWAEEPSAPSPLPGNPDAAAADAAEAPSADTAPRPGDAGPAPAAPAPAPIARRGFSDQLRQAAEARLPARQVVASGSPADPAHAAACAATPDVHPV
jgi:hypothetical protein